MQSVLAYLSSFHSIFFQAVLVDRESPGKIRKDKTQANQLYLFLCFRFSLIHNIPHPYVPIFLGIKAGCSLAEAGAENRLWCWCCFPPTRRELRCTPSLQINFRLPIDYWLSVQQFTALHPRFSSPLLFIRALSFLFVSERVGKLKGCGVRD